MENHSKISPIVKLECMRLTLHELFPGITLKKISSTFFQKGVHIEKTTHPTGWQTRYKGSDNSRDNKPVKGNISQKTVFPFGSGGCKSPWRQSRYHIQVHQTSRGRPEDSKTSQKWQACTASCYTRNRISAV